MTISTSVCGAQHPNAGQNIQQALVLADNVNIKLPDISFKSPQKEAFNCIAARVRVIEWLNFLIT